MVENKIEGRGDKGKMVAGVSLCLTAAMDRCSELIEEGSDYPELEAAAEALHGVARTSWPLIDIVDKLYQLRIIKEN